MIYFVLFSGSIVRPKVVRSVHYCPSTAKTVERRYTDLASLDPFPSQPVYPTTDEEGNFQLFDELMNDQN